MEANGFSYLFKGLSVERKCVLTLGKNMGTLSHAFLFRSKEIFWQDVGQICFHKDHRVLQMTHKCAMRTLYIMKCCTIK
jgi:hypothetical protein